jgi:hypothetical protein
MTQQSEVRTFEQRQIATFRHQTVERIVWQPRFSDWYRQNHIYSLRRWMSPKRIAKLAPKCPDLPREIYGMKRVQIYDYLEASPRYQGECWPIGFFSPIPNLDLHIKHRWIVDCHGNRKHKIITPYGELIESWRAGSSYPDERMLKRREDFKPLLYFIEQLWAKYTFIPSGFKIFQRKNNGRCVATASPWRSPYNKCIVELAGTKNTMLLMKRYPNEFDNFCDNLNRINFEIIMPVLMKSPVDFISCGDNVDGRNDPPPVYEKYILPFFERVAKECKRAGKFSFAHYDGDLELLLPYLGNDRYPFDGIEAPTFYPQGNVTLSHFRKALGDRIIVLDGIPSTIFLPHYTDEQFVQMVNDVLHAFSPNLILGVSDEFSPNGLFKRLQMVAGIVDHFHP